jgi:O-antigen ligase
LSATQITLARSVKVSSAAGIPSRIFYTFVSNPVLLFLTALAIILFRPPDLSFYEIDRIAIVALTYFVILHAFLHRQILPLAKSVNLPLLSLLAFALFRVLTEPYASQNWSVLAAKWLVPLLLFNLAGFVFADAKSLRKLEVFYWIVLSYLGLTSVFFLFGWTSLIFPRFILDESIGIHADRARGPFLQAVANGVALNLLALIALDSFRRRKLPKLLALALFVLLPLAILATKTRAVWLSFALSMAALSVVSGSRRVRRACLVAMITAAISLSAMLIFSRDSRNFSDRFAEASPVEFRFALYQAGWEMFQEKPLFGWSNADIQQQLENRINEFHQESFYFHNTFLEVAVTYGALGFGLYLWLMIDLLRLAKIKFPRNYYPQGSFFDAGFRALWPILLFVYIVNACFVVMNYQFVNGLIFSIAGILAAQDRRLENFCPLKPSAMVHAHGYPS